MAQKVECLFSNRDCVWGDSRFNGCKYCTVLQDVMSPKDCTARKKILFSCGVFLFVFVLGLYLGWVGW